MKVDGKLAAEAHRAGESFGTLFERLLDELRKVLPSNIELTFIEPELITVAGRYEREHYGEDLLSLFLRLRQGQREVPHVLDAKTRVQGKKT